MSYRLPHPHKHRDLVVHDTTQSDLVIDNGTIAHVDIPFFRKNGRFITRSCIMRIDHCGWPDPDHKDRSWQPWMAFNSLPIELEDEGYSAVEIAFDTPPQGLTAVGRIERNLVRVDMTSMCADAIKDDIFVPFSIYIVGDSLRDIAMKGTLRIVAGPINEG